MHALCWLFKCPFCRWMAKHFDRTLGTKGFASLPKLLQEEILAEIQRSFVRYAFFHMLARIRTWLFNVGLIFKWLEFNFFYCFLLFALSYKWYTYWITKRVESPHHQKPLGHYSPTQNICFVCITHFIFWKPNCKTVEGVTVL